MPVVNGADHYCGDDSAGMRARITIADVTLGNTLAIESALSQLAHRPALLCPGRQQTLKRTHQRRPARTQSSRSWRPR